MSPNEKEELIRLRWQINEIHRLVEQWHAEEAPTPETLTHAAQINAILQACRPVWRVLLPAMIFFGIAVLFAALLACRFHC